MFFTDSEKIGPKQETLPNGMLYIHDVPIARTGFMEYGPTETPIKSSGIVRVYRNDDQVFRPETLQSFHGMAVTDDHPPEDVTPANWKEYMRGVVLNPRRGTGAQSDLVLADMVIYDAGLAQAIRDGKREVSGGYEADYFQTGESTGEQRNIVGNHVAVVAQGRCGTRCAIGDKIHHQEDTNMCAEKSKLMQFIDRAFKAKEPADQAIILAEAATYDAAESGRLSTIENSLGLIKSTLDKMAKDDEEETEEEKKKRLAEEKKAEDKKAKDAAEEEEEEKKKKEEKEKAEDEEMDPDYEETDDKKKSKDSAGFRKSFDEAISLAEVISPGISIPTFDATAPKRKMFDAITGLRRSALAKADAEIVKAVAGRAVDAKMSASEVRVAFRGVAALAKAKNNDSAFGGAGVLAARNAADKTVGQMRDEAIAAHWGK